MNDSQILILTCGGTFDKVYFDAESDYQIGKPQISSILADANVSLNYKIESVLKKDSLDMKKEDQDLILEAVVGSKATKILIIHGTDTMIDTAKRLMTLKGRTIVFTGSMSPACFKHTDAVFNTGFAIAAVKTLPEGVFVAINGRIFSPTDAVKNHPAGVFELV